MLSIDKWQKKCYTQFMHKNLIFDLDGTLAPIGKRCPEEAVATLCKLESSGRRIILCSGKPVYYLCGFARQMGLLDPILVGENGAVIAFGVNLPFKAVYYLPFSKNADLYIKSLKNEFDESCGDSVWYQPNERALTPFPKTKEAFKKLQAVVDMHPEMNEELNIYRQCDCFDILPKNITKATGLSMLASMLSCDQSDFVAVGDGINDLPMFEFADVSIGIGEDVKGMTKYHCDDIFTALQFINIAKL